ncbi:MAG: NADH:ubiquinone reductase (Na(+)-transporting) subunit A [Verrucomicrobia bacterium]|nr:NADH:ubiquinone reductase (Na(+)-transporting) subunit A [Verrucomicrobiota bacterium]
MASYTIKKGLNLKLTGAPDVSIRELPASPQRVLHPAQDYPNLKLRPKVKEGDQVKRGTPLFFDKKNPAFQICAPAAGTVSAIEFGPRRVFAKVVIDVAGQDDCEAVAPLSEQAVLGTDRDTIVHQLQQFGFSSLIRTRPFDRTMNPDQPPKSIFVNAMATAPFQPDLAVVLPGQESAFRTGLAVLSRLTEGKVHLCLDGNKTNGPELTGAPHVEIHSFKGPHPAGNTSVHIHTIDPISPGDVVWAVQALDVIRIGTLFETGKYPAQRIISLAGPGLKENARAHYKVQEGSSLAPVLAEQKAFDEVRCVAGTAFFGPKVSTDSPVRFHGHGITVLEEDRSRLFLGWLLPGLKRYSLSRAYASTWLKPKKTWTLGTSQNGELRPMVLTGLYDKYMPINLMVDFLVRAVLAKDSSEAIQLGILETVPEDFAVAAFACPSKMDLCGIIQKGLDQIEQEGI